MPELIRVAAGAALTLLAEDARGLSCGALHGNCLPYNARCDAERLPNRSFRKDDGDREDGKALTSYDQACSGEALDI